MEGKLTHQKHSPEAARSATVPDVARTKLDNIADALWADAEKEIRELKAAMRRAADELNRALADGEGP